MELKLIDPGNDRSRADSLHSGRSMGPRRRSWSGRDEQRTVVKRNSYAPFGETFAPTVIDGTGYTGHVMDQATGLTYMQQRYYDPQIGRFLGTDPVLMDSNSGTNFNAYWYANNNPYRFTDPDGRQIRQPWERGSYPDAFGRFPPGGGTCERNSGRCLTKGDDGRSGNGRTKNNWSSKKLSPKARVALVAIVAKNEGISMAGTSVGVFEPGSTTSQMIPGKVILADRAFDTRSKLASVVSHEVDVHGAQIRRNDGKTSNDPQQGARWEATAYRHELENAERFNNTPSEVSDSQASYDFYKAYGEDPEDSK